MIAAVVLAAGAATRFGSPKQRLFLPRVLAALKRSPVGMIVVVSGAYPIEASAALSLNDVLVVACPQWALGPGASLRCGLAALDAGIEAAIVVLADGPYLDPRAIARVLDQRGAGPVLAASYAGARGHPVLLERSAFASIPDDGARAVDAALVACDDLTAPGDIDVPGADDA